MDLFFKELDQVSSNFFRGNGKIRKLWVDLGNSNLMISRRIFSEILKELSYKTHAAKPATTPTTIKKRRFHKGVFPATASEFSTLLKKRLTQAT